MKKVIICIIVIILIIGSVFIVFNKKKSISLVGTIFKTPLIEEISYSDNTLLIYGGTYYYGDINQDGIINNYDLIAIKMIIDNSLEHKREQELLGDFNNDNKVDQQDVNILEDYLDHNEDFKYPFEDSLSYCLTDKEDTKNCNWQDSKYISNIDIEKKDFYIAIKNNKTGEIGTYKYTY